MQKNSSSPKDVEKELLSDWSNKGSGEGSEGRFDACKDDVYGDDMAGFRTNGPASWDRPRARQLKELEVELEALIWSRWRSIEEWLKIGSSE